MNQQAVSVKFRRGVAVSLGGAAAPNTPTSSPLTGPIHFTELPPCVPPLASVISGFIESRQTEPRIVGSRT